MLVCQLRKWHTSLLTISYTVTFTKYIDFHVCVMAIQRISGKEPEKKGKRVLAVEVDMKPLARDYIKTHPESVAMAFPVIAGRLTTNGWFLIECLEFVFMIPGGGKDAMNLFEKIFPGLHNKQAKQLVAVLDPKDKFKAYLGLSDTELCWYHWDDDDYVLSVGKEKKQMTVQSQLSLEDFFGGTKSEPTKG